MRDYPMMITAPNHVEPVPRRVRATLNGEAVLDTTKALYCWEWPYYPQYYIPLNDVKEGLLFAHGYTQHSPRGALSVHGVRVGDVERPNSARVLGDDALVEELRGTVRFEWAALDSWWEEDERVFVHPRNPYVRVDALRSTRPLRVELAGAVLAESSSPVLVFETGLPTRYYINRTEVDFSCLVPTSTETECPYKGRTTGYWSVRAGGELHLDLAWTYDFPTRQLQPIAGLIAFYNEKVDIFLDGRELERPTTHFFSDKDG
jgi:uncharacterized protein (DUF427 family)